METSRPYFPFDTIKVPDNIQYATFNEGMCDWNLKIEHEGECVADPAVGPIFMKAYFNGFRIEKNIEQEEDGLGGVNTLLKSGQPVFTLVTMADEYILRYLYEMSLKSNEHKLTTGGESTISVIALDLDVSHEQLKSGVHRVTMTYKTKENNFELFGITGCCADLYEDAPFEGCQDEDEDPGGGPEPPDCSALSIVVGRTGDDLVATVEGAPGVYSVTWIFRPNEQSPWQTLIIGASSISLGAFGIYRAVLNAAGCTQKFDQYLYQDPCAALKIEAEQEGAAIVASIIGCSEGNFFIELWDSENEIWNPVTHDGTNIFMPEADGLYKIIYICDETQCAVNTVVDFDSDFECPAVTITITRNGNLLTAAATGDYEETPVWSWKKDTGSGPIPHGTGQNVVQINGNGLYFAKATIGGCTYEKYFLVLDEVICDECEISVSINPSVENGSGTLSAEVVTTGNLEEAVINWHLNDGSGWIPFAAGTLTVPINAGGLYRVRILIAGCPPVEAFYLNSVCEKCEEFDLTITREVDESEEPTGVFTAVIEGCEGEQTFSWQLENENGIVDLPDTGPSITPTEQGLYRVTGYCNGCKAEAVIMAYECDGCLEVFSAGDPNPIIVCSN